MNRLTTIMIVAAVALGGWVTAQAPPDLQMLGRTLRKNQEELRTYSWHSEVKFLVNGEQRRADAYQVRYDNNGWLQRMQTDGHVAKGTVRGPDGTKLSKKEREAGLEFVTEAKNQLDAYLSPLFAEKAITTSAVEPGDGTWVFRSGNVVHPGDSVEIIMARTNYEPKSLRAVATIDGSPMSLEVDFGNIEYGPFFPARSVTNTGWRGLQLTIVTENSGFTK